MFEKNAKIRELPLNRRSSSAAQEKLKKIEIENSQTFPLWAANAEETIKNREDLEFLRSMKTDRAASFGSHDKKLASQLKRKTDREKKQEDRRKGAATEQAGSSQTNASHVISSEDSSSNSSIEEDTDSFKPPAEKHAKIRHRKIRCGTEAFIPHDILKSAKMVSLATRMKLSPAQQAAFTQAFIEESGGDASKIATSYSTADRSRRKVSSEIATNVKNSWIPPKFLSLHWDSKLMTNQVKNTTEERLAVAVGDNKDIKLLGVPAYPIGTDQRSGELIALATMQLLQTWDCVDSVVNMTFDTTASNTGHVSAACITLQQRTGRALLWSACRHHVGEVILTQVFNDLQIETSKSPEYSVFQRFKKNFENVPHSCDTILSPIDKAAYPKETQTLISDWQGKAVSIAEACVQYQREDYREFTELCLLYLDNDGRTFNFRRPGAFHKARWMSKILYSIKMVLLEQQIASFPTGTITTRAQQPKLREFVTFVCLIYSTWWMTCQSAVDAPWHDLCLYQDLIKYEKVNLSISGSAIKALKRHLWYLSCEMVPLALFSDIVPEPERRYLADRLLAVQPGDEVLLPQERFGTGFGKPKFPASVTSTTRLGDMVSADSWIFFRLLQMDTYFLQEDVVNWPGQPSYVSSKVKTAAVNVVNDPAERGVKLSADYLDAARSEEHYQNVLQVVEADRKTVPNLRQRKCVT